MYIYICMYMNVHVYVYIYIYIYIYILYCIYVGMYVCTYVYMYMCIYIHVCTLYVHVRTCTCIYMYVFIIMYREDYDSLSQAKIQTKPLDDRPFSSLICHKWHKWQVNWGVSLQFQFEARLGFSLRLTLLRGKYWLPQVLTQKPLLVPLLWQLPHDRSFTFNDLSNL